jgi:hypothetical protein
MRLLTPNHLLNRTARRQRCVWKVIRSGASFLCVLIFATRALADTASPDASLHTFYAWVLAHPSRGLPSAKERTELAKTLSPELIKLLKAASEMEAKCVRAAPKDEKPLIVEGDLFVGNYEGATEIAYGEPRREGDRVVVESDLMNVDKRFPKAHKNRAIAWKDTVELRQLDGRWYVDEVRFAENRSLVGNLKEYIDDAGRSCR